MNAADFFPSKFLKATDITAPLAVTIREVSDDMLGQGADAARKLLLHFHELPRALPLNVTNYRSLVELTGSANTDTWIGTRLQLVPARVDFQGRRVPAIRIEPAAAPAGSDVGF